MKIIKVTKFKLHLTSCLKQGVGKDVKARRGGRERDGEKFR